MTNGPQTPPPARNYIKVPNFPCLYRHSRSGRYYGCKKISGTRYETSLKTTDRKIAERRLRQWITDLSAIDHEVEKTSLRELLDKFVMANCGLAIKTRKTHRAIIRKLEQSWPGGLAVQVRHIRPSHIDAWLALHEPRLRNTTYNAYAGLLKRLFQIAVDDRILSHSPFDRVKRKWKPPQPVFRISPTPDQFMAIVESIRSQRFTDHADESADFIEFLGSAGLGQAEASSLCWGDVNWVEGEISVMRKKTGKAFTIPIYRHLRPLLERRKAAAGDVAPTTPIFKINDAKKSLKSACDRLGFPHFSQRSLRQFLVKHSLRYGVHYKLVSQWQGHGDGGNLVLGVYSEARTADDKAYELANLELLPETLTG